LGRVLVVLGLFLHFELIAQYLLWVADLHAVGLVVPWIRRWVEYPVRVDNLVLAHIVLGHCLTCTTHSLPIGGPFDSLDFASIGIPLVDSSLRLQLQQDTLSVRAVSV
jgi:hypothetical protein